jgi:hypothetical protein
MSTVDIRQPIDNAMLDFRHNWLTILTLLALLCFP